MIRSWLGISKRLTTRRVSVSFVFSTKKYILSQFPYPSGQLHLGHARVYYIGDTLTRFYKMQNYQVIYPIGFDSFGLPAENAAFVHGKNPKVWTENNINQMKQQLNSLSIDFDWNCQIATHTPQYYKWTQFIFLQMFKKGLAYKAESEVNWDPVDKTVLANEQVDNLGRSWRSGAIVEKKMLSQWFFKITHYAEELQNTLVNLEWVQRVKAMQQGWIGFRKGYSFDVEVCDINSQNFSYLTQKQLNKIKKQKINVFVGNIIDFQERNCYIRFNKQSQKNDTDYSIKEIIIGYGVHPIDNRKIPIILENKQNGILFQFVAKMDKQKQNIGETESMKYNINDNLKTNCHPISILRMKDWLISRQRYWGAPIPIIYCQSCGIVGVPENELPVILPEWKNQGNPLLSEQFKKCLCPNCKKQAQRETDTMDTFVDSSWYYLRFLDPNNFQQLCSKQKADYWMPVDIYIGGIEHAIMHLLYARFIMRTLVDFGVSQVKEPFKELVVQGLVKGKAIRHKVTGKYLKPEQVSNFKSEQLEQIYDKMSKSKFNGLNPTLLVQKFGSDALRMAIFFAAPIDQDIDFHEDLLVSAKRFLKKVQETYNNLHISPSCLKLDSNTLKQRIQYLFSKHNSHALKMKKIIFKLQQSIEKRFMNVYVASTMQLYNEIKQLCKQLQQDKSALQLVFYHIFAPVLWVIAPQTTRKLQTEKNDLSKIVWPQSTYFSTQKELLIMKGNKLLKKDIFTGYFHGITEGQIRKMLNFDQNVMIKDTKKNVIVILN